MGQNDKAVYTYRVGRLGRISLARSRRLCSQSPLSAAAGDIPVLRRGILVFYGIYNFAARNAFGEHGAQKALEKTTLVFVHCHFGCVAIYD